MFKRLPTKLGMVLLCAAGLSSTHCGNSNKIWSKDDGAGDTDYLKAQAAYDAGRFSAAESLATKMLSANPDDERAAILLGYVHLSEGGIDPFILARQLISITSSNSSGSTAAKTSLSLEKLGLAKAGASRPEFGVTTEQDSGTGAGTAASSASALLTQLKSLVSLSDSDQAALVAHTFGPADAGIPSLSLFTGVNTLVVPNDVSNTLRNSVEVLNRMNMAIGDVCRFVDTDVIVSQDQRGTGSECAQTSYSRNQTDQAHFLWAFSHLVEAVAFQTVLLYVAPGNTQPSIDAVNAQLNTITKVTSTSELQGLISDVQEVAAAVKTVFNTSDTTSMIEATLTELNITVIAFGKLAGMPASIQASITNAFADITSASKTVAGGTSVVNNAKAFKTQVTTAIAQTVASKIQTAASSTSVSPQQKIQMCDAYQNLIADAPSGSTLASSTPAACSGVK